MKILQGLFIVVLLAAVGVVSWQLREVEQQYPPVSSKEPRGSGATTSVPVKNLKPSAPASATLSEKLQAEVESVGQLNDNPDEAQARLKNLAKELKLEDIKVLHDKALNTKLNGDERFLSVYVLGLSDSAQAQESLENIATAPIPSSSDDHIGTQEEIIRMHAVESLRAASSIRKVLSRVDNKQVTDRAQRTLLHLQGKAKAPEEQDSEAFEKLLEKNAQ